MSFCERENQKNLITKQQYLKTWKILEGLGSDKHLIIIVNEVAPTIAYCLQENFSTSDMLPVSNKHMSLKPMHMEASAFVKKTITFGLGCLGSRG